METRLEIDAEVQKRYLLEVEEKSDLRDEELAKLFGVVGRSYRDWRRGKYAVTVRAAEIVESDFGIAFPVDKNRALAEWIKSKSEGGRKGGLACYKKYGSPGTLEGRKRGGSRALAILRQRGVIPPAKEFNFPRVRNADLAEFIGILLGDGGITREQACITLNSEEDKEYLWYVLRLITELFHFSASFFKRKNCKANVIYCNGVKLINYLLQLGLKVGNKVRQQVDVPEWIKVNKIYSISCLRGLMDTDGGVFVHRYKVHGKEYKYLKICFTNRSMPLLMFVSKVLKDLGYTPKEVLKTENKKVWLYNQGEVLRYLHVVGTHNQRLYKRLEESDSLVNSGSLLNF